MRSWKNVWFEVSTEHSIPLNEDRIRPPTARFPSERIPAFRLKCGWISACRVENRDGVQRQGPAYFEQEYHSAIRSNHYPHENGVLTAQTPLFQTLDVDNRHG